MNLLALALHACLMSSAPVVIGLIHNLRARLLGLAPPPVLQPWRDLRRLLRKQPILPEGASGLVEAAPCVALAATAAAFLLVPSFTVGIAGAPIADLIAVAGLLGLARAALTLAALDCGTAPGGIAARRSATLGAFAEPALLLAVLALAVATGSSNIGAIATALQQEAGASHAGLLLAAAALALLGIAPGETESPLTLEFSGRHLALLEAAQSLRLLLWFDLLGAAFIPFGMALPATGFSSWPLGFGAWLARTLVLAVGLAGWQAARAAPPQARMPGRIGLAAVLGLLAALAVFAASGAA